MMTIRIYKSVVQPIRPTNRSMRVTYVWEGRGWMPVKRELMPR